jgi:tetratricopeptide (TPR) repeat protein
MSLYHLGGAYHELSRVNQAVEMYQAALKILQALDDRPKVIDCLLQLGRAYMTLGQDDQVVECFQQAERICRAIGDRVTEQAVISMSGVIFNLMGKHQEAIALHQQALQMALAVEYRWGEGDSHLNLGEILVKQRDPQNALLHLQQARLIYEELKEQAMLDRCKRAICRCNAAQKPG